MVRMNQKAKLLLAVVAFLLLTPLTIYYVLDGAGVFDTRSRADSSTGLPEKFKIADLNADNKITITDFGIWLSNYKQFRRDPQAYNAMSDLNADNAVTITDFGIWLGLWREYRGLVADLPFSGSGDDGDVTVTTPSNINRTNLISGRTCADGGDAVNYNIVSFNIEGTGATLNRAPSSGCLNVGDEVLIINLQGTSTASVNVGNWETLKVSGISGAQVDFETSKANYYGNGSSDDSNIGVEIGTQRVMLQRVPNYKNLTVASGIDFYPDAWATEVTENEVYRVSKGGVIFFRASESANINGAVHADGLGFKNGTIISGEVANGGEAFCGNGGKGALSKDIASTIGECGGGGGGNPRSIAGSFGSSTGGAGGGGGGLIPSNGSGYNQYAGGGGGAGYGTVGKGGGKAGTTTATAGSDGVTNSSGKGGEGSLANTDFSGGGGGGGTYGNATLSKLYFGSGGGAGGLANKNRGPSYIGGNGGRGGGIVFVGANMIVVGGRVSANGADGSNANTTYGAGGGGASGGTVRLDGDSVNIGTEKVLVKGGKGGIAKVLGGDGGSGRIAVYYKTSYAGTSGSGETTNFFGM